MSAALASGPGRLEELLFTPAAQRLRPEVVALAEQTGMPVREVTPEVMAYLTSVATAPDMLAVAPMGFLREGHRAEGSRASVMLVAVHDPATAGSIMASACAMGIAELIASHATVDLYRPSTVRAGNGAHFRLSIRTNADRARTVSDARAHGARVITLAPAGAAAPWEIDLTGPLLVCVPGEPEQPQDTDLLVAVPCDGPVASSLSARVAVVLYERVRQERVRREAAR